jgi:hypothetical protein
MVIEQLKVTWKFIRKAGYGRTKHTYCTYIVENENHQHKLKTIKGTKLFEMLAKTVVAHKYSDGNRFNKIIIMDGVYSNNELVLVRNFRFLS